MDIFNLKKTQYKENCLRKAAYRGGKFEKKTNMINSTI